MEKSPCRPKEKVMSSMEELIHQFMLVTEGVNCPPGEIYFGHENPKGETRFFTSTARAAARRIG